MQKPSIEAYVMAQQTKPESPPDRPTGRECTDSLVRTVAARLLNFQLQRGRRRTARQTLLLVVGLLVFAAAGLLVWYNWSAITLLFDTAITPSTSAGN